MDMSRASSQTAKTSGVKLKPPPTTWVAARTWRYAIITIASMVPRGRRFVPDNHPIVRALQRLTRMEVLTLIRTNGQETSNIQVEFQPDEIRIDDGDLLIEEGDTLRRTLKNGLIEDYLIIDRGYISGGGHFSPYYRAKVRKKTAINHPPSVSNNYHVTGNNSRINVDSSDSSTNTVNASEAALFNDLKKAIELHIEDEEQRRLILERVTDMEAAHKTPHFKAKYEALIQQAANHIIVLTPFIPQLTQLAVAHGL